LDEKGEMVVLCSKHNHFNLWGNYNFCLPPKIKKKLKKKHKNPNKKVNIKNTKKKLLNV